MKELSLYEKCLLRIELMKLRRFKQECYDKITKYEDKYNILQEIDLTTKYIKKAMKGQL